MMSLVSVFFRCCVFFFNFSNFLFVTCRWCSEQGYYWEEWVFMISIRIGASMLTTWHMMYLLTAYHVKWNRRFYAFIIAHYFTWQELLDLEDRIGHVSIGLREDEIIQSLRMVKYSAFNPKHFCTEMDRRCSICQVCPFSFSFPSSLPAPLLGTWCVAIDSISIFRKSLKQTRKLGSWAVATAIMWICRCLQEANEVTCTRSLECSFSIFLISHSDWSLA